MVTTFFLIAYGDTSSAMEEVIIGNVNHLSKFESLHCKSSIPDQNIE